MVYLSNSKNHIMKKILLVVALVGISYGLMAQSVVKPMDSLLLRSPNFYKNISPGDTPLFKKYFVLPPGQKETPLTAIKPVTGQLFASRMPILKITSDDKMPIAKIGSDDRMPVVKVTPIDPLKAVNP
jgi:hypothetical protein